LPVHVEVAQNSGHSVCTKPFVRKVRRPMANPPSSFCDKPGCGCRLALGLEPADEPPFAFRCEVEGCGYACAERGKLAVHARIHTGEKPFHCEEEGCGYACATRSRLIVHARSHTRVKPFRCAVEGCGYASALRSSLVVHARTHPR
jgi:hypothetical protein